MQKSKNSNRNIDVKKLSQSCSELSSTAAASQSQLSPNLYCIKEEEDDGRRPTHDGSFRRKIFAKSKTLQPTVSISPVSSLKGSNQSLSSLKKQVSFDDSLSEAFEADNKLPTEAHYDLETNTNYTELVRSISRGSHISNATSSMSHSDDYNLYKYPAAVWGCAAVYCMMDSQLVKPRHDLCPVTAGRNVKMITRTT